jgi:hypothetical protein
MGTVRHTVEAMAGRGQANGEPSYQAGHSRYSSATKPTVAQATSVQVSDIRCFSGDYYGDAFMCGRSPHGGANVV